MTTSSHFDGKRVLVTGCSGTVGTVLLDRLLEVQPGPSEVIGLDNNESALFFQDMGHRSDSRARFFLCDVQNAEALRDHFDGIDIVFHLAALKHVDLCERAPAQAVATNIGGLQNVISAALTHDAQQVVFASSDKAANPTNVMGTTKLMGERLISAANANRRNAHTLFSSTRFGNVLGSNGSVVAVFRDQIRKGQPVTITDRDMTRFVMSAGEAVQLLLQSAEQAQGGEVFVTKMPALRITDLADAMIAALHDRGKGPPPPIVEIGAKAGEKLWEELLTEEESRRTVELDRFFVIRPAFSSPVKDARCRHAGEPPGVIKTPFVSRDGPFLAQTEIIDRMRSWGLI